MLALRPTASMALRVRIEERTDRNDDIYKNAENTLEVIRLSISQERTNDEDGKDESHRVENFKVHIHADVQAPADEDDKWGVEQRGLNRGAEDMGQGEVHLIVPSFIDGC